MPDMPPPRIRMKYAEPELITGLLTTVLQGYCLPDLIPGALREISLALVNAGCVVFRLDNEVTTDA